MESELEPGVYSGRTSLGPSPVLVWLGIAVGGIFLFQRGSPIALGPIIVLGIAAGADAVLSSRALRQRSAMATVNQTAVTPPERVAARIDLAPGDSCIVTPYGFDFGDTLPGDSHVTVERGSESVELTYPSGGPIRRRFIRWGLETTTLGLVVANRVDVAVLAGFVFRGPEPGPVEKEIASVDEQGRLREYVSGDRWSRVSWPATARTGKMHVRDTLISEEAEVSLVVDLGTPEEFAADPAVGSAELELALARAARIGLDVVESGMILRLVSTDLVDDFFVAEAEAFVEDPARKELPDLDPLSFPVQQRNQLVGDADELCRRLASIEVGTVTRPPAPYVLVTRQGVELVS